MALTRVAVLVTAPLAFLGCATDGAISDRPDPDKNYRLEMVRHVPRQLERLSAQAEGSLFVEESELRNSQEPHVAAWRADVMALRGKSELEMLEGVNVAANERVTYITDYAHWGVRERWGFPIEALEEGGDCEDIALLKMESLHLLGWPEDRLFLLVGTSDYSGRTEGHAVLLVTLADGSQLILDSVTPWILPPGDDHHFFPLYAVNGEHYYKVAVHRDA